MHWRMQTHMDPHVQINNLNARKKVCVYVHKLMLSVNCQETQNESHTSSTQKKKEGNFSHER